MNLLFADAYYFVALLNIEDSHHHRVAEFSESSRSRIVTTGYVLLEVANAMAR